MRREKRESAPWLVGPSFAVVCLALVSIARASEPEPVARIRSLSSIHELNAEEEEILEALAENARKKAIHNQNKPSPDAPAAEKKRYNDQAYAGYQEYLDLQARLKALHQRREQLAASDLAKYGRLELTGNWKGEEAEQFRGILSGIGHPDLKRWMVAVLAYDRRPGGSSPVTAARYDPPTVGVYDGFFGLTSQQRGDYVSVKTSRVLNTLEGRKSYLGFEAGKVFYMSKIDRKKDSTGTFYRDKFFAFRQRLDKAERPAFDAMAAGAAGAGGGSLTHVIDPDDASRFGYVFRAAVFNLQPPSDVEKQAWSKVRKRFVNEYLLELLQK